MDAETTRCLLQSCQESFQEEILRLSLPCSKHLRGFLLLLGCLYKLFDVVYKCLCPRVWLLPQSVPWAWTSYILSMWVCPWDPACLTLCKWSLEPVSALGLRVSTESSAQVFLLQPLSPAPNSPQWGQTDCSEHPHPWRKALILK